MSNKNSSIDFLVCAVSLAAISVFFFLHSAGSSDIFWQMKAGEVMWGSKEFLSSDLFSFTMRGKPWINFEWFSEIIFYVVWRLGGFAALSILSFVTGLGLASVLFSSFSRISGSRYLALLLVFSIFFIGVPRFGVLRPELFGFLFFAVIFHLLATRKETADWRMWFCLPLIVIWANVHPSVIFGVLLVVIYFGRAIARPREMARDFIFTACCILAPFVNPLGCKIYTLPFNVLTQSYAMDVTSDWVSPAWFSGEISFAAWGLVSLAVICVVTMIARRRFIEDKSTNGTFEESRYGSPLMAAAVVFTIPALLVSRFIPFAAIAWAFLAARTLSEIEIGSKFRVAAVLLCLGTPILMFHSGPIHGVRTYNGKINFVFGSPVGVGFDEADFPVAAADFIENASFNGEIFNDMAWGGYLIWRLWPRHKVFIDTRTHLYGDAFIKEYADALFNEDAFKKVAKKYNIGCVIYDKRQIEAKGGPLKFLSDSPQWKRKYDIGNAAVFLK